MRLFTISSAFISIAATIITGCTISFQNISTHGTATDLIDENQGATADVSPDVSLPAL